MAHYELDTKRLLCPMPVIKTQQKVKTLQVGDELTVHATDPGALQDIPAWCRVFGHEVLGTQEYSEGCTIHIKINKV